MRRRTLIVSGVAAAALAAGLIVAETAVSSTPAATVAPAAAVRPAAAGLPAHVLEGYWQDFSNGAKVLTLAQVPASYNIVAVAFGTSTTTPGQVAFSIDSGLSSALGGYSQSQFISDIKTLHSRGQKVILSVGGADGAISVSDSASAAEFASSVDSLIKQYGFDGVDIDLENGVNPTFMAQALNQLHSDVGSGLIITMAPQTVDVLSAGSDYFALALNIKSILTIMNTQFYNSGSMNGCDGNVYSEATENFITALACIQLKGGLNPSQVGLGLPASPSAAGGGDVDPSVVDSALNCLASGTSCGTFKPSTTWPSIGGAMTWSINWDASNGFNFANSVSAALAKLPGGSGGSGGGSGGGTGGGSGGGSGTTLKGKNSGLCLSIKGNSATAKSKADIDTCNGGTTEKWTVKSNGTIVNGNGLCLSVSGASVKPNAAADADTCSGSTSEKWTVNSNGTIKGSHSGLCLSVTGGSKKPGAIADISTCNTTASEKWAAG